jgi:hypothetical protein
MTLITYAGEMLDVTEPYVVEVQIRGDSTVVWVNVNGICLFRACRIGTLIVTDERKKKENSRSNT